VKDYFQDYVKNQEDISKESLQNDLTRMIQRYLRNETGRRPVVVAEVTIF
jgi:mRNA degradation ribonuclease J1/J2